MAAVGLQDCNLFGSTDSLFPCAVAVEVGINAWLVEGQPSYNAKKPTRQVANSRSTASNTVPRQINTKPKKSKPSKWDLDFDKKESPKPSKNPPECWETITKHAGLSDKLRSQLLTMVNKALDDDKLSKQMDNITQLSKLVETIDKVEKANQTGTQNGKVNDIFSLHLPFTYDILFLYVAIPLVSSNAKNLFHSQRMTLSIIMLRGRAAAQPRNIESIREWISTPTPAFPKTRD